jgi:hypothetical protein
MRLATYRIGASHTTATNSRQLVSVASATPAIAIIITFTTMASVPHTFTSRRLFTSLVSRLMIRPSFVRSK